MEKTKKTLLAMTVSLLIMFVSTTTVIYGSEEPNGENLSANFRNGLFARTAEILSVNQKQLMNALDQAFVQLATERVEKLVKTGWLGEKRADIMKERIGELSTLEKARTIKFFICNKRPYGERNRMKRYPGNLFEEPRR